MYRHCTPHLHRGLMTALLCSIALAIGTTGCDRENAFEPAISLVPGVVMVEQVGDLDPINPYQVRSASLLGGLVELDVLVSGGCGEHDYAFFVETAFRESSPVQTFAYLVDDSDDPCDAIFEATLRFDLRPLRQAYLEAYGEPGPIRLQIYTDPGRESGVIELLVDGN